MKFFTSLLLLLVSFSSFSINENNDPNSSGDSETPVMISKLREIGTSQINEYDLFIMGDTIVILDHVLNVHVMDVNSDGKVDYISREDLPQVKQDKFYPVGSGFSEKTTRAHDKRYHLLASSILQSVKRSKE